MEQGLIDAIRLNLSLMMNFSWIFFLFTTKTKGYHFASSMSIGKAGYIATGRGYAIDAVSLASLYAVYAKVSMKSRRIRR